MAVRVFTREKFDISSDALLISSGAYAAVAAVALPLWWWVSGRTVDPATPGAGVLEDGVLALLLVLIMLTVGMYLGPAIAWALHGRHQRPRLMLAPVVSTIVVFFIAILGEPVAALFQTLIASTTSWEYAGPATFFGLLGAIHLGLVLYALLRIPGRADDSPWLKASRYAALICLALLTVIILVALKNGYDATVIQALLVILFVGYGAGLTTHLAAILDEI